MSAMTASAAATRVAASARTVNSGKGSSSRVISANAVANKRNGVGQSAQFFQGDRSTAAELRQRAVTSPVSRRSVGKRQVAASASVPAPVVQAAAPAEWKGAKLQAAALSVGVGLAVQFLLPCPAAVAPQAWTLLAIFLSTITGLVLTPLPVGAWAFLGLSTTVVTKTLTFQQAFSAMTNDVIWLIVLAFFFAKGFVQTGLGDRVATFFVKTMGKSTLGLSYGLSISEALLAPAMPSTTARAGGVYLPIIKSLAKNAGSEPGPTANKLGAFLIQTQLQSSGHSSAMCMTAAAQNLLSLKLAASLGVVIASPWLTWFKAACVPAIVGRAVTPLLVFKHMPPEIQDTPDAPLEAAKKLEKLGPLSQDETMVVVTMGLTVLLWIFGDKIGMSSVTAAMLGMSLQLFTGVITWADCLNEKGAWDTLLWFAVLIGMSAQLNQLGFISFLSDTVAGALAKTAMGWQQTFVLLHACYFGIHYLFASQTAQVAALSTAFMAMMIASGAPPMLAGLTMAFHTNLFGAITHYASGQGAVYFGAGFVDLPTTFKLGGILGIVNVLIWGVVGGAWWKVIGLY